MQEHMLSTETHHQIEAEEAKAKTVLPYLCKLQLMLPLTTSEIWTPR